MQESFSLAVPTHDVRNARPAFTGDPVTEARSRVFLTHSKVGIANCALNPITAFCLLSLTMSPLSSAVPASEHVLAGRLDLA
mmetsp:Transcript_44924/g.37843  ORF Transcript_44924/g.37843 Transcript_44924/m.37843 type:complete len:82 (-) Transcript_44924:107-352(-)